VKALLPAAAASLLLCAAPAAAQTQGLTVADFLLRAQALMMGGQVSKDSPELKALLDEVAAAGKEVRARQAADQAAGRPATFCLPANAKAENDLFAYLQKLPAARRGTRFREAFADYAKAKYPCPAR
jgi:hypothetical protein